MEFKLKTISPEGIDAALSKAEVYRFLNQAGRSGIDLRRCAGRAIRSSTGLAYSGAGAD